MPGKFARLLPTIPCGRAPSATCVDVNEGISNATHCTAVLLPVLEFAGLAHGILLEQTMYLRCDARYSAKSYPHDQ